MAVKMDRIGRRLFHKKMSKYPKRMKETPESEWPEDWIHARVGRLPIKVWASCDFLAQAFDEISAVRISISRAKLQADGRWADKITWDELMEVKRQCGYDDHYAIEIYPRDMDIVNVANMRHLWVLPYPLNIAGVKIGWFSHG